MKTRDDHLPHLLQELSLRYGQDDPHVQRLQRELDARAEYAITQAAPLAPAALHARGHRFSALARPRFHASRWGA